MPTNKQRREAARRHLERQLQRRQEHEVKQKRRMLIGTVAGTLVLAAIVVIAVVALSGGSSNKTAASTASPSGSASGSASGAPSTPPTATPTPTPSKSYPPAKGAAVSFDGVTVKGAKDLAGVPGVTSKASKDPAKIEYKDLVVGTGKAATPKSTVTVQYDGVLYKNGKEFDSSWKRGMPAQFPLTGVIKGFTQGIGGTTGVPPMKIGGRRIIIMPGSLAYGANPPPGSNIPKNAPLVFVVDLKAVS